MTFDTLADAIELRLFRLKYWDHLHSFTAEEKENFVERASICEYDGGISRVISERIALKQILDDRKERKLSDRPNQA